MSPRRRLLAVACAAMLLAVVLAIGAGVLLGHGARLEALGVFVLAFAAVALSACAVPKADE